jgi:hypothetical protein
MNQKQSQTPSHDNQNHSNYQRGSNIPTQPSVPKMPTTKPPAQKPSK